eukprot:IDg8042t1
MSMGKTEAIASQNSQAQCEHRFRPALRHPQFYRQHQVNDTAMSIAYLKAHSSSSSVAITMLSPLAENLHRWRSR